MTSSSSTGSQAQGQGQGESQELMDTGDGDSIYWEVRGNPDGKPVVVLHGGPGCGMPTNHFVDPKLYRAVYFDQRNCGRSTPHASDPGTDLSRNTTEHLVRDMEQLREHLGLEKWMVVGGSWGSALAVAYAERHPERVSHLVLLLFWQMGRAEVDWLYRGGVAKVFPEQYARFLDVVPEGRRGGDPAAAYVELLVDPDPEVRSRAALAWASWENAVLALEPHGEVEYYGAQASDELLAFARICAHYAAHDGWMEEGALLRDAGRLAGIPGTIIHGRHDLSCPLGPAWDFAQAWPEGKLVVIEDSGHKGSPAMRRQYDLAMERFAW